MPLLIVESPNKISKIKKCLDDDFTVMASVGHFMDLAKKDMGIDLDTFTPHYEVMPDKQDVVKGIKEEAKNHDVIYLATDPDREGEQISENLLSILPKKGKKIYRVVFKELTKKHIQDAIKKPRGFDEALCQSQQARRMIDRIAGFKVSSMMWTKGLRNTSAGRVQSAGLKFITDREKEIRAFKKEEYWTIKADTELSFSAELALINGEKAEIKNEKESDGFINDIDKRMVVSSYEKKDRVRNPDPPFITSSLQVEAGNRFKWSGQKIMDIAQNLFSQGLITYHRTDSIRTEPLAIDFIREKIKEELGQEYLSPAPMIYTPKAEAQDAHEAIRPTLEAIPMGLGYDEKNLYDLISNRFMASQMASAIFEQAKIELTSKGKKNEYVFKTTGSVLKFDGFLKIYGSATKDLVLPPIKKNQKILAKEVIPQQHFTKPPPRYTSPSFVEKVKKENIGRPSTYATIAETLINRGYVERKDNTLFATEIGILVSDYLEAFFSTLTEVDFTAEMEDKLDKIASGDGKVFDILNDFYNLLKLDLENAKKGDPSEIFKTEVDCPSCKDGSKMSRRVSEGVVFLSCKNYPECGHTMNFTEDGKMVSSQVETGLPCPECGNKVIERDGKWGKWLGCSAHPTCTWTGKLDDDGKIVQKKKAEKTDIACGKCKKGTMVKRQNTKTGEFFLGCNRYPECKTIVNIESDGSLRVASPKKTSKAETTGQKCPTCKKGEIVKRPNKYGAGFFEGCSTFPKCKHFVKL